MKFHIIWLDSLKETILWTFRSWWAAYPVPPYAFNTWIYTDPSDPEAFRKDVDTAFRAWNFMHPFFFSRGYTLYTSPFKQLHALFPDPIGLQSHPSPDHPFARRAFDDDSQVIFDFSTPRVWPARDHLGRDVVMKLVSGRTPSKELRILQRLNTQVARMDPRNHTIHVLEYITFGDLVFVVMPRWPQAFAHDFGSVSEILQCLEHILEAFDFLHENRIAHCDFLPQNVGINVMADEAAFFLTGMREPGAVRYAIYDFGHSEIYPLDTDIQTAESIFFYAGEDPNLTLRKKVRPFKEDMLSVGRNMQRYVRHLESSIPEFGPFFDSLTTSNEAVRLTARQALEQCRYICSNLNETQLTSEVTGRFWDIRVKGHIVTKLRAPLKRYHNVYERRDI